MYNDDFTYDEFNNYIAVEDILRIFNVFFRDVNDIGNDNDILEDYVVRDDSGNIAYVSVAGMNEFLSRVRDFYTVENDSQMLSLLDEMGS